MAAPLTFNPVAADLATKAAGLTPTLNPYSSGIQVSGTGSSTPWSVGSSNGQLVANTGFGNVPIYTEQQFSSLFNMDTAQQLGLGAYRGPQVGNNQNMVFMTPDATTAPTAGSNIIIGTPGGGQQNISYRLDPKTGYYIPSSVQGNSPGGASFFDQVIKFGAMAGAAVAGGATAFTSAPNGADALTQAITEGYNAGTAATPLAGSELASAGVADAGGVALGTGGVAGGAAGGISDATLVEGIASSAAAGVAPSLAADASSIATQAAGAIAADAAPSGLSGLLSSLKSVGNLGSAFKDIGGAVSDLFGASGARQAAGSYQTAADIATLNARLEKNATAIQTMQIERQVNQTIGSQEAAVAASGLAESGSALDILRDSQTQGSLAKAMVHEQGDITANAYLEQAALFEQLSNSAKSSGTSQTIGAGLNLAGGAFNLATNPTVGSAVSSLFSLF